MKVLFDVNHPAHVHFFKNPALLLEKQGCEVLFTSRKKEMTTALLDSLGFRHHVLSSLEGGTLGLFKELLIRDYKLLKFVLDKKPCVMASIGGTFVAHVGFVTRIPSVVFYDTENASLQNSITYPFASEVVVPQCYGGWLPKHSSRYSGYHELSYLHPDFFSPCRTLAENAGIDHSKKNIFLRLVSWQANHDVGETGWTLELLQCFCDKFGADCNLLISSETELPKVFEKYIYRGQVEHIHHVLAFSNLVVGESATMASESAVLGVPAIYMAETGRGYTDEQESLYGLVKNIRSLDVRLLLPEAQRMLEVPSHEWQGRRQRLLDATVNVAEHVVEKILRGTR